MRQGQKLSNSVTSLSTSLLCSLAVMDVFPFDRGCGWADLDKHAEQRGKQRTGRSVRLWPHSHNFQRAVRRCANVTAVKQLEKECFIALLHCFVLAQAVSLVEPSRSGQLLMVCVCVCKQQLTNPAQYAFNPSLKQKVNFLSHELYCSQLY